MANLKAFLEAPCLKHRLYAIFSTLQQVNFLSNNYLKCQALWNIVCVLAHIKNSRGPGSIAPTPTCFLKEPIENLTVSLGLLLSLRHGVSFAEIQTRRVCVGARLASAPIAWTGGEVVCHVHC